MKPATLAKIVGDLQLSLLLDYRKSFTSPHLQGEVKYSSDGKEHTLKFEDNRYDVSVSCLEGQHSKYRVRVEKKKKDFTEAEKKAIGKGSQVEGRRAALFEY